MSKKKVLFVTSSRADYSLQKKIIELFSNNQKFRVYVIITGTHLSKYYGLTKNEIHLNNKITKIYLKQDLSKDKHHDICKIFSKYIEKFNDILISIKADLSILLGDRYEILSAAMALSFNKIPIIHLHGGESTFGSDDDTYRDIISKLSEYHFVSHSNYKKKLISLGLDKKKIFNLGAFCSDNLNSLEKLSINEIEDRIQFNINNRKYFVFTYHPESKFLENETLKLKSILECLKKFTNICFILTSSNHDPLSNKINKYLINFSKDNSKNFHFTHSLGSKFYLNLINYSLGVIGNSSSGVIEAPYFKIPTVNIGLRQHGRYMHQSVINSSFEQKSIISAIKKSLDSKFIKKIQKMNNLLIKKNVSLNCHNKISSIYAE